MITDTDITERYSTAVLLASPMLGLDINGLVVNCGISNTIVLEIP